MDKTAKKVLQREDFHVIELGPGAYFSGDFPVTQIGKLRVNLASVGTPLLAKRLDPNLAVFVRLEPYP